MTVSSYHIGRVIEDSWNSDSTRKSNKCSSISFSAVSSATTLQSYDIPFLFSFLFHSLLRGKKITTKKWEWFLRKETKTTSLWRGSKWSEWQIAVTHFQMFSDGTWILLKKNCIRNSTTCFTYNLHSLHLTQLDEVDISRNSCTSWKHSQNKAQVYSEMQNQKRFSWANCKKIQTHL